MDEHNETYDFSYADGGLHSLWLDRACWGLGIGPALTGACIECTKEAGYAQVEPEVFADNTKAIELYKSVGFAEYGRSPMGFRSRLSGWQELVMMQSEL